MEQVMGRCAPTSVRLTVCVLVAIQLASCIGYRAAPLPAEVNSRATTANLRSDLAAFRLTSLQPIRIDPRDGLDPLEVAALAVLNSPDLQAKRVALRVNAAEVFAAGLLPDPQIDASIARPIAGPDTETAYSLAPSVDLAALITRSATRRAARFTARQADLDLLWAEWSVAEQARGLAETVLAAEGRAASLRKIVAAADERYLQTSRALEHHDTTLQVVAADLAVKLDAESQLAATEREASKARRDLNALLNVKADVALPLVRYAASDTYDAAAIARALATLPRRRPDLLALRAGYDAQDARLRKAILSQFPLKQAALAFARDTGGVVSQGGALASALPIFNGSRGDVRIQDSTREQLRAEYQARLDQAEAEVKNAQAELADAARQTERLRREVPRLESLVQPAVRAYQRGDIDSQTYLTLTQNVLSKRAELDNAELAARAAELRLETVLFLPPATSRSPQ